MSSSPVAVDVDIKQRTRKPTAALAKGPDIVVGDSDQPTDILSETYPVQARYKVMGGSFSKK